MKKTAKLYKAKGLYIGTSTVDGWGVFLEDPIKTGEIIEYIPVIQKVSYQDREKCGEIFTHTAFPYLDGKHFWSACGYMSMINHSEDSNVEWKIDYYNNIAIFKASKDIPKDTELYINYFKANKDVNDNNKQTITEV